MAETTLDVIRKTLSEDFEKPKGLDGATTVEALEMDSLDLINFLFRIEELTAVKVPDEALTDGRIGTLQDLADYVDSAK